MRSRVEDVQRVARSYLNPDRLTIVLVGDASAFTKQLAGAGFDKFEVIPAGELDLFTADLRRKPAARGGYQPASFLVPGPAAQADAAKMLLNKAIASKGGLPKLQGIKTLRMEGTMTSQGAGGPVVFPVVTSIEYPDRFRVEASMPGGTVVQVYANGKYWIQSAEGVRELDVEAAAPIRAAVERDVVRVLLRAAAGSLVVREVDGNDPRHGAIEVSGPGTDPVTLHINRDNGLIEKAHYAGGPDGRSEELYSDYRNVAGIQVPFHTVVKRGSLLPLERDIKTIRYNVPLSPALFQKPS